MRAGRKRGRWIAAAALAAFGIGLAALWLALPRLLDWAAPRLGERLGIPGVALHVASLGLHELQLSDLRAGAKGEFAVGSVRLAYSASGLERGRIDRLEIDDVRLRAALTKEGLSLPPFDRFLRAAKTASPAPSAPPAPLPVDLVRLEGVRLLLDAAGSPVEVEVDGPLSVAAAEGGAAGARVDATLSLRVRSKPLQILAAGDLEAHGDLRAGDTGLVPDLHLALRGFNATWEKVVVEGAKGEVSLAGLPPVTTQPGRLQVARVVSGSELTQGNIRFRVDGGRHLVVEDASFRFAGGVLRARGRLDPAATRQRMHVDLRGVDMKQLLAQAAVPGLDGTGRVDGSFDVAFGGGDLRIEKGAVSSKGDGGWIRYRPPGHPRPDYKQPEGLDVATAALDNFRYRSLGGTLAGDAGKDLNGDLKLALRLEGANPDLYNGYPIKLDFNLKGPFFGLLRSANTVTGVPKALERRFGEGKP